MASEGRSVATTAGRLESASFVRIVTRADGDALAASGLLARTLSVRGTPFQITVARTVAERRTRLVAGDADDLTVVIGHLDASGERPSQPTDDERQVVSLGGSDRPISLEVASIVTDLGESPDPLLALAGCVCAGVDPDADDAEHGEEIEQLLELAREADSLERRPGVAIPVADVVDGLTHSTRCLTAWSGSETAVRDAFEAVVGAIDETAEGDGDTDDVHQTIASIVAIDAVADEEASRGAATAIARFLRPYAIERFETLGGYAEVLEALARVEPGTGVALAMGHDADEPALDAWRSHGRRAHEALASASTARYDGLWVLTLDSTDADAPLETVARLALEYRSPESSVLVVGTGTAALATNTDALDSPAVIEAIERSLESEIDYDVGRRRAHLAYDPSIDDEALLTALREVLER